MKKHLVYFFLLLSFFSFSQSQQDKIDYYSWFDAVVGVENSGLYNGVRFKEKFKVFKDNHEFYRTSTFLVGDILYDKQPFFKVPMKYDAYNDMLIVKIPYKSVHITLQLIKEKIEYFKLEDKLFANISKGNTLGFYEVLFENSQLVLYKKHKKIKNRHIHKKQVYTIFKDQFKYFIKRDFIFYRVKSKGDFTKLFPQQKKKINIFYRLNRVLLKLDMDTFMVKLLKHLNTN